MNGQLGLYSEVNGSNTIGYTHLPGGSSQTISETIGSSNYYYINDLRGSTVALTDSNGNVVNTYSYDPYGNSLTSTGTVANAIRYVGGYYDTSTGLYKMGARYYNSAEGRWTQIDPSGKNVGYIYAGNNPVNNSDPSGLVFGDLGATLSCFEYLGCLSGGVQFDHNAPHFYLSFEFGSGEPNVYLIANKGDISTGLSGTATCNGGVLGTNFQGVIGNFNPYAAGCGAGLQYTF